MNSMEGNTNGGTWPPTPQGNQGPANQSFDPMQIGMGEGEAPLAKPSEKMDMRTMASDIASMQETGGGMPRPYTPQATPQKTPTAQTVPAPKAAPVSPPNMAAKDFAASPVMPSSVPTPGPVPENAPSSKKGLFVGLLVFVLVVGIAAAGYFFIYPMFNKVTPPAAPSVPAENPAPAVTPPAVAEPLATGTPTSTVPGASSSAPLVVAPSSTPSSVLTIELHSSFFKNPADLVFDTKLSSFGIADLKAPLTFSPTSVPLMREIVWKTQDNKPLSFAQVAGTFFPSFFTPQFTDSFQPDVTMFSYTNGSGTWLGFVAKLKDGVTLGPVQTAMSGLQKSPDLAGFYLADPGTKGVWKDAKILNHPASVIPFSVSGATFGYVWFDRYLVVTSNLDAATEAAHRLGY